jgi:leucine dehydrogenase
MTYKAAVAGLNLGGGKAVILGDSRKDKSEAYFRRYGKFVDSLGGKYITAEDVGTSKQDMEWIAMETKSVSGLPEHKGGSGDPSPVTAYGVYMGMKAAAKYKFGSDNLAGKKVLVQGTGHVGETLISYLSKEGAIVFVSDIHQDKMENMVTKYGAHIFTGPDLYSADVDIYSPCALGATINYDTVYKIKAKVIAGAANNQLAVEDIHGPILRERGIAYAPDFLINAGGIINVYGELVKYAKGEAMRKTENIYNTTLEIFSFADINNLTTQQAAMQIAQNIIDQRKKENASK